MENATIYFSLIVIFIMAFMLGVGLGFFLKTDNSAIVQVQPATELIALLSSKPVSGIMIYGTVEDINDRNIRISNQDESIVLEISAHAKVYKTADGKSEEIVFEDIKKGDALTINSTMTSDGKLRGDSVYIFTNIQK
jgi:hypothetical protein